MALMKISVDAQVTADDNGFHHQLLRLQSHPLLNASCRRLDFISDEVPLGLLLLPSTQLMSNESKKPHLELIASR